VLDAGHAVEGGGADAVRVTDVPDEEPRAVSPDEPGPVDRPSYLAALVAGLLGAFGTLFAVVVITVTDGAWRFAVLAVPALLIALSAVLAYRFFRRPSEGV
jgi:VIT1/CCC1 family predicted Fe2+/Mn2+ transporter